MLPRVSVAAGCWAEIVSELDRVAPCEAIALPLLALLPRGAEERNPCAPLELEDLEELVIARVVLVPEQRQINALARVSVLPLTDELVNARAAAELRRFPRLRACAYLHSHPFARGSTWPSSGMTGDLDGHMRPLLRHNADSGLHTSFSFIACRTDDGGGWRLQGFALDRRGEVIDLGFAEPLAEHRLRRLLLPPLGAREPFRHLLRRWRRELRRTRVRYESDDLFDGWRRTIVELDPQRALVILLPLDFPLCPLRCFVVDRAARQTRRLVPHHPTSLAGDAWLRLLRQVEEELDGAS
jgi:hypothetical protein